MQIRFQLFRRPKDSFAQLHIPRAHPIACSVQFQRLGDAAGLFVNRDKYCLSTRGLSEADQVFTSLVSTGPEVGRGKLPVAYMSRCRGEKASIPNHKDTMCPGKWQQKHKKTYVFDIVGARLHQQFSALNLFLTFQEGARVAVFALSISLRHPRLVQRTDDAHCRS